MIQLIRRLASPPNQILTTLQPTPSTVLFRVSTRPVPKTLLAILNQYVSLLLRILIGGLALLSLLVKWDFASDSLLGSLLRSLAETSVGNKIESTQWRFLGPGVMILLWFVLRRGYTEESLLVLKGLGLQTSTSSSTYLQAATTRFIPTTSVQDIFIHEAFKGFEVRYYLAVVIQGEGDVVVVFPALLPRRAILEEVWRGAKACLYEHSRSNKG
ncbi:GPI-GlcNAc transferase complex, PIG-H component-domain-containing protein [Dendryphion nanum]|uniref:GPI-GlcNAc transferase complex, PIG-H component-domain-containing protein n=1 Tax=Dendryphion nanum TaxID=256645 RepID=A0A9P9E3G0_9PLEO|nr:GPI-GlcNAc transferase complex, PIG-H component-domain-containing protein [Dendryphion nanum]